MIQWDVSPAIIELGPIQIRWYSLMFILGFSLGLQGMRKICQFENKSEESLDPLLFYVVLGTTLGARLGHVLFYDFAYYLQHPLEILKIWEGGLASHGGGLGVIIALWLFSRKYKDFSLPWMMDRIAIFVALTGSFIRIGNLMNSEILGKPWESAWAFIFMKVDQIPRHPTQIYESICYLITAVVSWGIYKKYRHRPPQFLLFGSVIAMIFFFRFFLEYFKENQMAFEGALPINMGQILSLPYLAIGLMLVFRALNNPQFEQSQASESKTKKRK